jgi:hypothetical protein
LEIEFKTYRPYFKNLFKIGVLMPIMGGKDKFQTSSLLSTDCKFYGFKAECRETNEVVYTSGFSSVTEGVGL